MIQFPTQDKPIMSLKERFSIVNKIIKLCFTKELSFSVNSTTKGIVVFLIKESVYLFNENAYYSDSLYDYTSEHLSSLTELLEKVKQFKN